MSTVRNPPRVPKKRKQPTKPTIVTGELKQVDWDTRVETYPEKPTRIIKARFIRVEKPPFEFRDDEVE
jgi:hypothetical protein